MGGLRSPYEIESLEESVRRAQFGHGIITDTHMIDEEVGQLQIPGYSGAHKDGKSKHRGGVMLLASPEISYRKLEKIQAPPSAVDACSCAIHPARTEDFQLWATG